MGLHRREPGQLGRVDAAPEIEKAPLARGHRGWPPTDSLAGLYVIKDVIGDRLCSLGRYGHVMTIESEGLIRQYAAGEITWSLLRQKGFDNYRLVLAALGELGLRPPIAPMDGPNVAARERGRAVIREGLKAAQ